MTKTTTNQIPDGWEEITLEHVMTFSNGKTSPKRFKEGNYPVYGSNGIIGYSNETNSGRDTLIIGRVGAYCGSLYYSAADCWVTDNAIRGRVRDNADPRYMYYLLSILDLNSRAGGSGQPLLNQSILNAIEIVAPKKAEQKAIADVLSSLDDKIELLRKQNETLEAIAQAIFKEWFVNFNFPDIDGKPYKDAGGKMINSELGEIPEGWRVGELKEIAKIDWGNTSITKRSYVPNGEFLGVSAAGCDGRMEHKEYNYGAVVISAIGEYCGRVFLPNEDFTAIKNTLVVTQKASDKSYFVYLGLQVWTLAKRGAAQPFISKGDTEQHKLIIPPQTLLEQFEQIVSSLFEKARQNNLQIRTLSRLRDTMLPKLMSGQVRVRGE